MKKSTVKAALGRVGEIDEMDADEAHAAECGLEVVIDLFEGHPDIQKILTDAMVICGMVNDRACGRLLYNLRCTYAWMDQWRSLTRRRPGRELGSNPNLGAKRYRNTHK